MVPVLHPKVCFLTYQAENLKHLVMLSQETSYQRADGFCVLVTFYRRKEMLLFKFAFGFQTFKQFFFLIFYYSSSQNHYHNLEHRKKKIKLVKIFTLNVNLNNNTALHFSTNGTNSIFFLLMVKFQIIIINGFLKRSRTYRSARQLNILVSPSLLSSC